MGGRTVLLVEDEPTLRELVAAVLRDEGYAVVEVRDGLQAIQAVEQQAISGERPNVILLDMMLPRVDGLEVLHHLSQRGADMPVVAMSASPYHLAAAAAAGATTTLGKPFELDDLLAVVDRHCPPCH